MSTVEIMAVKALSKSYRSFTALHPADLSIARGEILGLVGKNGAGKTTLLKLITGQALPDAGELKLFSATTPQELRQARQRIGAIVETPCFYRDMTALQNLEYYRIQRGIPGKEAPQNALLEVGLENTGAKKFKDFSLGMKQRLGLALALMNHPDFLVLDEPLNGLDPVGIVEIRELLLKLNREKHITMLISCHVLAELQHLATTYAFIDQGKLVKKMTGKQLEEACSPYLRLVADEEARAVVVLERQIKGISFSIQPDNSVHIYNMHDRANEIVRALAASSISIHSLEPRRANLEDYFLTLVGGGNPR